MYVAAVSTTLSCSPKLPANLPSKLHTRSPEELLSLICLSCITHKESLTKKKKNAVQSFLFICNIDPLMRCLKGFKDRQTWCDRNRSDHQSCFHLYTTFNHFKVKCRRRSDSYVPGNKVSRADWLTGWLIVSPQHLSALMRLVIH